MCQINRSGLRTRLENAGYGDKPYGDRHLSLAPAYRGVQCIKPQNSSS